LRPVRDFLRGKKEAFPFEEIRDKFKGTTRDAVAETVFMSIIFIRNHILRDRCSQNAVLPAKIATSLSTV
jgi:hypothetical protein